MSDRKVESFNHQKCQRSYALMANTLFGELAITEMERHLIPQLSQPDSMVRQYMATQLANLESLAQRIIRNTSDARLSRDFTPEVFLAMTVTSQHLNANCEPSPTVSEFRRSLAIWQPNLIANTFAAGRLPAINQEMLSGFIQVFRQRLSSREYRQRIRERRRDSQIMRQLYREYFLALRYVTPRSLVIALELHYASAQFELTDSTTWQADLNHFFRNRRHNRIFDGYRGFVAEIRFSAKIGFHWRLVMFFDGNEHLGVHHVDLANSLGTYWCNQITQGRGKFQQINRYNPKTSPTSNNPQLLRYPVRHSGYGAIDSWDTSAWDQLSDALIEGYCTHGEWIRFCLPKNFRNIRKGRTPPIPAAWGTLTAAIKNTAAIRQQEPEE